MRNHTSNGRGSRLAQGGSHVIHEIFPTLELLNYGLIGNWVTKLAL